MKRVLLKLSGEALAGDKKTGFDEATCIGVAKQVKQIVDQGIQVAIVTGGGNFWRGRTSETIDRTKADQIGMLATVMNCIYVSDIFRHVGMKTEVFTPFVCGAFTSLFSKDAAVEALNEGKVIFFAGGTGHPYFSTDTGAVLRAIEIEADAMLLVVIGILCQLRFTVAGFQNELCHRHAGKDARGFLVRSKQRTDLCNCFCFREIFQRRSLHAG